jgi:hypothetical protein
VAAGLPCRSVLYVEAGGNPKHVLMDSAKLMTDTIAASHSSVVAQYYGPSGTQL